MKGGVAFNPDPTLIGPINHRQQVPYDALWVKLIPPRSRWDRTGQASDGPSELSVPRFDNSPEV